MPDYDPIYLTFNDKPKAVLLGFSDLLAQRHQIRQSNEKRKRLPLLLFLLGFPFMLIDLLITLLGYPLCLFSLIAPVCWLAALILIITQRRSRVIEISPIFDTAREVIYTLRDDIAPKRNLFGHLDLTGSMLPSKLARETKDALGRTTNYYRDEWLSIKTKLYDGNMLRLAGIKHHKIRQGYWKRSAISGKMKWKAEKFKGELQELKVRLSVNPEVYDIAYRMGIGTTIGGYQVTQYDATGGIINLTLRAVGADPSAIDILSVLQNTYKLIQRKV